MEEHENGPVIHLWSEICKQHWTYLETEESLQKIKERTRLEKCLLDYLSIVPHDRKFLLGETSYVLKKSILYMQDFSASKACAGFESISQYANNLFTKPWRKEYKTIKMFCGFFQHEVKNNLFDAERLFEGMGYRRIPNSDLLVLDEAICPDQVTNVSRDAMAAFVECQIIKEIFSGLTELQLSCSLADIYKFREHHTGTAMQIIKLMSCNLSNDAMCSRFYNDNVYNRMHSGVTYRCNNNSQCAIHPTQKPWLPTNLYCQSPYDDQSKPYPFAIPHSRSLDQYDHDYSMSKRLSEMAAHRHSLDQSYNSALNYPPMENFHHPTGYDIFNNGTNVNIMSIADYNIPRNRIPLDHALFSRFSENPTRMQDCHPDHQLPPSYTFPNNCSHHLHNNMENVSSENDLSKLDVDNMHKMYSSSSNNNRNGNEFMMIEQPVKQASSKNSLQGILKKDSAFGKHDYNIQHFEPPLHITNKSSFSKPQKTIYDDKYLYTDTNTSSSKVSLSTDLESNNESDEAHINSKSAQSRQEGVGSYESWNYVFKNLEKQKYKPDDFDASDNFDRMAIEDTRSQARSNKKEVIPKTAQHRGNITKVGDVRPPSGFDSMERTKENLNEWSCTFCTYLNKQNIQICEMCSKSKDFALNLSRSNATCV